MSDLVTVAAKISTEEARALDEKARAAGVSKSEYVRRLIVGSLGGGAPAAPVQVKPPADPPAGAPAALRPVPEAQRPRQSTTTDPDVVRPGEATFVCNGCGRELPLRRRGEHYKGSVLYDCPRCRQVVPSREREAHYEREHSSESRIESPQETDGGVGGP